MRKPKLRKIIAITQLSLDGVMQAPGGPEEDPKGNFTHGGWAMGMISDDDLVPKYMEKLMAGKFDLLLGRRTYDIWTGYWPHHVDNYIGKAFAKAVKYVVTRGSQPLPWKESVRIGGLEKIRKLQKTKGPDLHVWGSSDLLQSLIKARLVDEHQIWIFPAVLGYGKRLFEPGTPPHRLQLVKTQAGSGGIVINTYRQNGSMPSLPMARIKTKKAAAGKASAKKPSQRKG
jgi:dihydrofolate reductase